MPEIVFILVGKYMHTWNCLDIPDRGKVFCCFGGYHYDLRQQEELPGTDSCENKLTFANSVNLVASSMVFMDATLPVILKRTFFLFSPFGNKAFRCSGTPGRRERVN